MPSAWRGEATNSMPKRPMSKLTLPRALTPVRQPLQPPADTERSLSERPNKRRISREQASGAISPPSRKQQPSARWPPSCSRWCKRCAPSGHASAQIGQNTHAPRSIVSGFPEIAPVGQASMQAAQPSGQREPSSFGFPRKRRAPSGGNVGNHRRAFGKAHRQSFGKAQIHQSNSRNSRRSPRNAPVFIRMTLPD